jgi:hypothetical protein
MNNILVIDNFIEDEDCDFFISKFENSESITESEPLNYSYCDVERTYTESIEKTIIEKYKNVYPHINLTPSFWKFNHFFRIKKFENNNYFDQWHCEHDYDHPLRIACVIVYLSDHNCGTEFFDKQVILSKKGRLLVFPTFWTHLHKGQPCPEMKNRYIMSNYLVYVDR